jgi:hypothetical protein
MNGAPVQLTAGGQPILQAPFFFLSNRTGDLAPVARDFVLKVEVGGECGVLTLGSTYWQMLTWVFLRADPRSGLCILCTSHGAHSNSKAASPVF